MMKTQKRMCDNQTSDVICLLSSCGVEHADVEGLYRGSPMDAATNVTLRSDEALEKIRAVDDLVCKDRRYSLCAVRKAIDNVTCSLASSVIQ